mmetsp:Transcript_10116/g.15332  ORF Transcript_10116/g.15332 Transcript_10116/m.15332 type:complete len:535 (-) Transcript_10116:38-1642(-)|eukprot:CAMPEP_0185035120 /NCGR_PEP_ID=MMETSP1103-20130426/25877_1 /TAXON_ID=36769 /ORGANISM="Paraphysomonas bandaiensis, Strain Caron Lab Isolate" /LENGTH=534 /DNA_ID=CAMNT_0027572053 /DNA_START=102 /DNA_END=1706 /DNA_ORIENTATION=-
MMRSPKSYFVCQESSNNPGEDRYSTRFREGVALYSVIDGHGGCFACEIANSSLLDIILDELGPYSAIHARNSNDIIECFYRAFKKCDEIILDEAIKVHHSMPKSGKTGCCAAVAALIGDKLFVAHVGDCRVVLCRSIGESRANRLIIRAGRDSNVNSGRKRPRTSGEESPSTPIAPKSLSLGLCSRSFLARDFHVEALCSDVASNSKIVSKEELNPTTSPTRPGLRLSVSVCGKVIGHGALEYPAAKANMSNPPLAVPAPTTVEENITTSAILGAWECAAAPKDPVSSGKRVKCKIKAQLESEFDFAECTAHCPSSGLSVHCLTKDHSCDDKEERAAVRALCPSDNRAMRPSANDKKLFGKLALKRVGGSLSVTRALGDGYLKTPSLSEEPYVDHVPYISALPFVSCRNISLTDTALVIASDGLWNYIEAPEVAATLREYLDRTATSKAELATCREISSGNKIERVSHTSSPSVSHLDSSNAHSKLSPAHMLLEKCLRNAAAAAGTTFDALRNMPSGPYKRNIVDDITILVVIL